MSFQFQPQSQFMVGPRTRDIDALLATLISSNPNIPKRRKFDIVKRLIFTINSYIKFDLYQISLSLAGKEFVGDDIIFSKGLMSKIGDSLEDIQRKQQSLLKSKSLVLFMLNSIYKDIEMSVNTVREDYPELEIDKLPEWDIDLDSSVIYSDINKSKIVLEYADDLANLLSKYFISQIEKYWKKGDLDLLLNVGSLLSIAILDPLRIAQTKLAS